MRIDEDWGFLGRGLASLTLAAALAACGEDGPFGTWARMRAGAPAATPPVARAGPPVVATARHVPTSTRSHRPRRRRRVLLENLDSSMFRPS